MVTKANNCMSKKVTFDELLVILRGHDTSAMLYGNQAMTEVDGSLVYTALSPYMTDHEIWQAHEVFADGGFNQVLYDILFEY